MKEIPLRRRDGSVRAVAIVDDGDYAWINQWRWSFDRYAVRNEGGPILMHRLIMGFPAEEVDHWDRDKLNNQRVNLRLATHAQNVQNQDCYANNTSGYRGVTWDKSRGRWSAKVRLDGHTHNLGRFDCPKEAADVAAEFRRVHMPFSADARV